jgi:hypothetical protein
MQYMCTAPIGSQYIIAGIYSQKLGQLVSTYSALQLAAEHKAEYTDR